MRATYPAATIFFKKREKTEVNEVDLRGAEYALVTRLPARRAAFLETLMAAWPHSRTRQPTPPRSVFAFDLGANICGTIKGGSLQVSQPTSARARERTLDAMNHVSTSQRLSALAGLVAEGDAIVRAIAVPSL